MKKILVLLRILALICALVGLFGLLQLWAAFPRRFGVTSHFVHTSPIIVRSMYFVSAAFCCALIVVGVKAFRLPQTATGALIVLFTSELAYILFLLLLPPSSALGANVGAAFGIGTVGLDIQIFTAFPLWGLLLSIVARKIIRQG